MTNVCCPSPAGKNGVVSPDQVTFDYVQARSSDPFEPVYSDDNANFVVDYRCVWKRLPGLFGSVVECPACVLLYLFCAYQLQVK